MTGFGIASLVLGVLLVGILAETFRYYRKHRSRPYDWFIDYPEMRRAKEAHVRRVGPPGADTKGDGLS
jgi:hypothetical protein